MIMMAMIVIMVSDNGNNKYNIHDATFPAKIT